MSNVIKLSEVSSNYRTILSNITNDIRDTSKAFVDALSLNQYNKYKMTNRTEVFNIESISKSKKIIDLYEAFSDAVHKGDIVFNGKKQEHIGNTGLMIVNTETRKAA